MKLSKELINELSKAKSASELVKLAKDNGIDLDINKAEELLNKLSNKELLDNDLEDVTGGIWSFIKKFDISKFTDAKDDKK